MSRAENFTAGSGRVRLYHYGGLGDRGEKSVRERGLLTYRDLEPDDADHPHHERVWAFTHPEHAAPSHANSDRVVFDVPAPEVELHHPVGDGHVASVRRSIRPDEIVRIDRRTR